MKRGRPVFQPLYVAGWCDFNKLRRDPDPGVPVSWLWSCCIRNRNFAVFVRRASIAVGSGRACYTGDVWRAFRPKLVAFKKSSRRKTTSGSTLSRRYKRD